MTNSENLQWFPTNAPSQRRYDDIYFINASTGWTVNSDGKILKTTDGGVNWQEQFQVPGAIWLRSVGFTTPLNGWERSSANYDLLINIVLIARA